MFGQSSMLLLYIILDYLYGKTRAMFPQLYRSQCETFSLNLSSIFIWWNIEVFLCAL